MVVVFFFFLKKLPKIYGHERKCFENSFHNNCIFSEEAISFYVIFIRLLHVIFNIQSPISANEVRDFLFNRTLHNKDNL